LTGQEELGSLIKKKRSTNTITNGQESTNDKKLENLLLHVDIKPGGRNNAESEWLALAINGSKMDATKAHSKTMQSFLAKIEPFFLINQCTGN
jgi:hypothetical protein